ncbi:hypothetical protein ANN_18810 [Periplaneta americana]|uniref:Uncharacterized protein n=1 Tax=Periplaneta americana TaxID=6978 RepID=A0ABQ8SPU2_PERAM|nr:hypothetical protein ANN_18810 [Periplaneta americana]
MTSQHPQQIKHVGHINKAPRGGGTLKRALHVWKGNIISHAGLTSCTNLLINSGTRKVVGRPERKEAVDSLLQYDYIVLIVADNVHLGQASPLSYAKGCSGRGRIEHAISKGAKLQAIRHNKIVKQNRFVIERLMEVVSFLHKQEQEDESFDNKGNYLELLLELLSRREQFIRHHLQCSSGFKVTSSAIESRFGEVGKMWLTPLAFVVPTTPQGSGYFGMVTSEKEEACETKKNMESLCHANDEGPTHAGGGLAGSRRMAEGNSGQPLKSGEAHQRRRRSFLKHIELCNEERIKGDRKEKLEASQHLFIINRYTETKVPDKVAKIRSKRKELLNDSKVTELTNKFKLADTHFQD